MTLRPQITDLVTEALVDHSPAIEISTDPNVPFDRPADRSWAEIRFVDGAETFRSVGGVNSSLAVTPLLAYITLSTPKGTGDGTVGELAEVVKNSLRRTVLVGGRWKRFEEGSEGSQDDSYRKQVVALFWKTDRR